MQSYLINGRPTSRFGLGVLSDASYLINGRPTSRFGLGGLVRCNLISLTDDPPADLGWGWGSCPMQCYLINGGHTSRSGLGGLVRPCNFVSLMDVLRKKNTTLRKLRNFSTKILEKNPLIRSASRQYLEARKWRNLYRAPSWLLCRREGGTQGMKLKMNCGASR